MTVTIYELRTSAMKRVAARLSRNVTVELGTGRQVIFDKKMHVIENPGRLSKSEEFDYLLAGDLVGA